MLLVTHNQILDLVVNESANAAYVADVETYQLYYMNRQLQKLLGILQEADWHKQPCYQVVHGLDKPCKFCAKRQLNNVGFCEWDFYSDHLQRHFTVKEKLVSYKGRKCCLAIAADVTSRENALKQLNKQLHSEKNLVACIQALNKTDENGEATSQFLKNIGEYYCAQRVCVFEIDHQGQGANTYEWCNDNIATQMERLQNIPARVVNQWQDLCHGQKAYYLDGPTKTLQEDACLLFKGHNVQTLIVSPMLWGNEIMGFVGVDNPCANTDNLMLIEAVSAFAANSINRQKLMRELRKMSYADMLTGMGNRNGYIEAVRGFEQQPPQAMGAIFADLNKLKAFNDSYGHGYGDTMIARAAGVLNTLFPGEGYRIGGDEFVILHIGGNKKMFLKKLEELQWLIAQDPELDLAIGMDWQQENVDVNRLIYNADQMMYQMKHRNL